ncbi:MAG: alkyl hydroperoxide reductase [Acidobacteriales bacterium]|nr:alkyl hydroperoxide reductase [Terriglobales bacterium]
MRNAIVLTIVAIVVAAMIYTGARNSRASAADPRVQAQDAALQGDLKGKTAPNFELATLDGKKMSLAELKGKAVLLNFWATWCGPCKIEMPWFVDLQKQYGPQGLTIVGIAMDDSSNEDIAKFAKEMGVNYPILKGKEAVGEAYGGVLGLPTTFYIGRDGKIVDQSAGLVGRKEIEDNIKAALAQGVGTPMATAENLSAAPTPEKKAEVK